MNMSSINIINSIRKIVPDVRIRTDEPMAQHTSFRIGGTADVFVIVCNEEELSDLLRLLDSQTSADW